MRVRMYVSPVNTLRKGAGISLGKMIVVLTSNAASPDTVRDTLTTSTSTAISSTSTSAQTINKSYSLKAMRGWKVTVTVRDTRDSVIHFDTATTPVLYAADTAIVNLGLTSRFSMYEARFLTIPDSVSSASGNVKQKLNLNRLVLKVDGVTVRDSTSLTTKFDSLATHVLGFDYVRTASETLLTSGTAQRLNSIAFISAQNGFAVGNNGAALKTTNAGATWSSMTVPSGAKALRSVYFFSPNRGWIAGDSVLLRTTNGGTNWTAQTTPASLLFQLQSLHFTDSLNGVAVSGLAAGGAGNQTMYKTTDGGVNWTAVGGTQPSAYSIRFATAAAGWMVGFSSTSNIRKSTDGGATWNTQTSPTTRSLKGVHAVNASLVYAVGDTGTILRTTNGGTNWTAQTSGTTRNLKSVYFLDAAIGYAVGDNGTIATTADSGATWTVDATPPTTSNLSAITFFGSKGYGVGENGTLFNLSGPRLIEMLAYGPMGSWNVANPLFSGSKYVNVAAGSDATIALTLSWVGPTGGTGSISATLGKVGKVTINGTLPGTIVP